ncbi:SseB family protein [Actinomadura sp. 21ATH]|uniref:SseB family protein n=1 Tax=Actinomadura sp. 21ATH TaxID=1735444 RepID=UPI0035BF1A51
MDWNDFAKRLTIELMRLPVQAYLIVQDPSGLPYVQAMRTEEEIDAEAVSSAFLPRPLSPRQERRLTINGWERPDDADRRNWWYLTSMVDRSGRPAADAAERCAALAGRMVAAFRDVYGVRGPLDLVYQAGSTDEELAAPMDLPGLGLPRAVEEEDLGAMGDAAETGAIGDPAGAAGAAAAGPRPGDTPTRALAARLETALAAARERGDQEGYMAMLTRAVLYLPSPADTTFGDAPGHQYATAVFGDETFVLAFTSPAAMDRSLRGQAVHHRQAYLAELGRNWPNPEWQLAINPGLPSAAYLDAAALFGPAGEEPPPDPEPAPEPRPEVARQNGHAPGNGLPASTSKDIPVVPKAAPPSPPAPPPPPVPPEPEPTPEPEPEPQAAERPRPAPRPDRPPGHRLTVMQKVVPPEQVAHYLKGGYDLVGGYVHRLRDVRDLDTPAALVRGLGLVYEGTPFQPGDEAIHVIRWPAIKPVLFRKPLGGIDEWSMSIIPGGWVIEKAPFPGSGYAPGEGPPIPEFKIVSQRLPHGAEMYRIRRSGREELVAGYDADRRQWLPSPGARIPDAPPARHEERA